MLRRFLSDTRGNYMLLTAAAIIPIMGGLAVAVDYSEMSRQRQFTLNALDAAGVATARQLVEGSSDTELIVYAQRFFEANLGGVSPSDAQLQVTLPTATGGGTTVKLSADLVYKPYFLPTFNALIGKDSNERPHFTAFVEVQLKNTLEVALVLDNSGSMDYLGSGSGKKRMVLLKDAAKQLVATLAQQASQIKQMDKPVQFGVVPFAASVNVGPQYAGAAWMDLDGRSPIHHENFDWTTMAQQQAAANGNRYVQNISGVYYKKGTGWGAAENQKITRFSMFEDLKRQTGTQRVRVGGSWVDQPVYGAYASWQGCVEARPHPYNVNDAAPTSAAPATLFVPMFAPDETDNRDTSRRSSYNSYWGDNTSASNNATRQKSMPKYFAAAPLDTPAAGSGEGPNLSCTTTPITPLTDVTTAEGLDRINAAIDAMASNGGTNVPEGIAWGWRAVSSGAPFSEGRPEAEKGNDKVLIVLTDGENTYYTPNSLGSNDLAGNKSTYSAYGYTALAQPGGSYPRLFMGTGGTVAKSTYTNDNYSAALNDQMAQVCGYAKDNHLIVMTVGLDLSSSDAQQKKQIAGLKDCASDSRFRKDPADPSKPAKLFWNTTGGNLSQTFKEIADELSNLRIVS